MVLSLENKLQASTRAKLDAAGNKKKTKNEKSMVNQRKTRNKNQTKTCKSWKRQIRYDVKRHGWKWGWGWGEQQRKSRESCRIKTFWNLNQRLVRIHWSIWKSVKLRLEFYTWPRNRTWINKNLFFRFRQFVLRAKTFRENL